VQSTIGNFDEVDGFFCTPVPATAKREIASVDAVESGFMPRAEFLKPAFPGTSEVIPRDFGLDSGVLLL
jgi:hypothetical protein